LAELAFPLNLTFSLMEKELRGAGCAEGTFTAVLDCWLRRLLAELAFPLNLTFSLMEKELRGAGCAEGIFTSVLDYWLR